MKFLTLFALCLSSFDLSGCASLSGHVGTKSEGALPRLEAHSPHGHSPRGISLQFIHKF